MKSLRIGFIGGGFITMFMNQALRYTRGAKVTAIYSPTGVSARRRAVECEAFNIGEPVVCESIEALVQNCDVVGFFGPNFAKVENVQAVLDACLKHGVQLKGVMMDKPLGRNVAEAMQVKKLGQQLGCPMAYFENQIFMPGVRTALAQLTPQIARMGNLNLVRSAEEHGGPHEPWFWDPTKQGGGVWSDMGCHSIAVSEYCLTPPGEQIGFLEPVSVNCTMALLKWGLPEWRAKLVADRGVDYAKTPAEDYATGTIKFRNPKTGQIVIAQATDSWMFEKQGLRLMMEGMGPGYAFEANSLTSPLQVFIGDAAADAVANAESALEKATASRGLLCVQPNEADLYGYVGEMQDAVRAFQTGGQPGLNWEFGVRTMRLVMAGYLSAELGEAVDLTDPTVDVHLEGYVPAIQRGEGHKVLGIS